MFLGVAATAFLLYLSLNMVLASRMRIAGGGVSFTLPSSPIFDLAAAPSGGWSWFGDPRAVHHGGYLYVGYLDGSNGNVEVRAHNESTAVTSAAAVMHAALEIDDHANPSLLVRDSDHKLMVFYSSHFDTTMRLRISTNSLDSDPTLSGGFASEVSLDSQIGAQVYIYANPIQLTGETNDPIYLWFRDTPGGSALTLTYSKSTDGGATWGAKVQVATKALPATAYWKLAQNGDDRIDIAITDDAPLSLTGNTSMFHFYMEGGLFYKSDGTQITATMPFAPSAGTIVHDASGVGEAHPSAWMQDIAVDPLTNRPVIAYALYPTTTNHRYWYGRWTGSAWDNHEIAAGGSYIDGAGSWPYSGGMAIDRADTSIVFASRNQSGQFEISEHQTTDGGTTWTEQAVTAASAVEQVRPAAVHNPGARRVVWMAGTYDGFEDYSVGTHAFGN